MKTRANILIIDDNAEVLTALKIQLNKHFTDVRTEKNPNLIPGIIATHDWDVVILDMNFSAGISTGNEGLYWMKRILESDPSIAIVFLTAYGDVELAVRSIRDGAIDFIQKPWDNDKMLTTVLNACKLRQSKMEIRQLKDKQHHLNRDLDDHYQTFFGSSKAMKGLMETVSKISATEANVLITGENGTGKELIAREIHRRSERRNEIFVKVDMGSLSQSLFESELFGHTKGAFTDANTDRAGRFEIASGGTLFLDEIGNLELSLQSKILTVLQNRVVSRIGSAKPVPVDIRLIAATNRPVNQMVQEGSFREDLLYRLNTIHIELPPLRNRMEDIPKMAEFFLEKFQKKYNKPAFKFYPDAIDKLLNYSWPGNIREFENAIEKAVILAEKDVLTAADFQFPDTDNLHEGKSDFNLEIVEKQIIARALSAYNRNLSETAKQLGITRSTLYRKMGKYEL